MPDGGASIHFSQFGSLRDWRRVFESEAESRRLFESLVWPAGACCPHCCGTRVWRFRSGGRRSRPGLWECGACHRQFTATTKTPLHGTKLPIGKWLEAFYLILGSSKGMSSVVLARHLGVTQTTAWKMGHALRELLVDRPDLAPQLRGAVEVDVAYVGGAPRQRKHVYNARGKATEKRPVLLAAARGGDVTAQLVKGESIGDLAPVMTASIDPAATLMSDGDKAIAAVAKGFAGHHSVRHSLKEWAFRDIHVNTAESYNLLLHRAVMGVYHRLSGPHLQRYLNELVFRWNQRKTVLRERDPNRPRRGKPPGVRTRQGKPQRLILVRPYEAQLADLLRHAVGRQVRWTKIGGLRWPRKASLPEGNLRGQIACTPNCFNRYLG